MTALDHNTPLSAERLAEIRRNAAEVADYIAAGLMRNKGAYRDRADLLAEVDRLRARVGELTSLLNNPDRLAEHLMDLRAILAEQERDAEIDRLADGGEL